VPTTRYGLANVLFETADGPAYDVEVSGDGPAYDVEVSGDGPAYDVEVSGDGPIMALPTDVSCDDPRKGRFYGSAKRLASFKSACLWAPFLSWKSIFGRFLVIFGRFWKSPDCRFTVLFNFPVFK
jgi:hypothetical protein